jgi:hypothetical protein
MILRNFEAGQSCLCHFADVLRALRTICRMFACFDNEKQEDVIGDIAGMSVCQRHHILSVILIMSFTSVARSP